MKSKVEAEYNPDRFPALVVKFKDPKISLLIFGNGKINVTRANRLTDLRGGVSKPVDRLRRVRVEVKKPRITVTNVVCTADLGLTLSLEDIVLIR